MRDEEIVEERHVDSDLWLSVVQTELGRRLHLVDVDGGTVVLFEDEVGPLVAALHELRPALNGRRLCD